MTPEIELSIITVFLQDEKHGCTSSVPSVRVLAIKGVKPYVRKRRMEKAHRKLRAKG